MEKNDFVGYFERRPVENLYHTVEIILNEDQLVWKNDSDQSWKIDFDGEKLAKADDEVYEAQVFYNCLLLDLATPAVSGASVRGVQ